jgi:membrane-associated phospholipid phosphatase
MKERLWPHRAHVLELFVGVLVPLCALAVLARLVIHPRPPWWDVAVLEWIHAHATPERDRVAAWVTVLGNWHGVVPCSIVVAAWLLARRRGVQALFFTLAMAGTGLLNHAAKAFYGRERPALWVSIAPESWFGFPSGHAMGSMALGTALSVLAWPTRARWPVAMLSALFVVVVSLSRLYLGVHYPSDVLGAWLASVAWVLGLRQLLLARAHRSPRRPG